VISSHVTSGAAGVVVGEREGVISSVRACSVPIVTGHDSPNHLPAPTREPDHDTDVGHL